MSQRDWGQVKGETEEESMLSDVTGYTHRMTFRERSGGGWSESSRCPLGLEKQGIYMVQGGMGVGNT